jgi:hypothetical protein
MDELQALRPIVGFSTRTGARRVGFHLRHTVVSDAMQGVEDHGVPISDV